MSFVNFKFVRAFRALVLMQELHHIHVVVEFNQAEHVVGAKLRHVNLANVGR